MKELRRLIPLLLFIAALLSTVSFSQGLKSSNGADFVRSSRDWQPNDNPAPLHEHDDGETTKTRREMREMEEINDYGEPKPNVNPRSGALFTPPTPTPTPPTPPPSH